MSKECPIGRCGRTNWPLRCHTPKWARTPHARGLHTHTHTESGRQQQTTTSGLVDDSAGLCQECQTCNYFPADCDYGSSPSLWTLKNITHMNPPTHTNTQSGSQSRYFLPLRGQKGEREEEGEKEKMSTPTKLDFGQSNVCLRLCLALRSRSSPKATRSKQKRCFL